MSDAQSGPPSDSAPQHSPMDGVTRTVTFAPATWARLTQLAVTERTDQGTMLGILIARQAYLQEQLDRSGGQLVIKRGRRSLRLTPRRRRT
jgi:hypothetical protein